MNVTCLQCKSTYRVDPAKVPERGVTARCARCPGTFPVQHPQNAEQHDQAEEVVVKTRATDLDTASPAPQPEAEDTSEVEAGQKTIGDLHSPPAAGNEQPMPGMAAPENAASEMAGSSTKLPPAPFGSADPHARARRLARALVSDIAVYNPERRASSLRDGTLRREFRDEIRKSWDEYVAQVGNQIARETSYFRDALNEILAEGAQLF